MLNSKVVKLWEMVEDARDHNNENEWSFPKEWNLPKFQLSFIADM